MKPFQYPYRSAQRLPECRAQRAAPDLHGYAYVGGNPVNFNDPNGLAARAVSNIWDARQSYYNFLADPQTALGIAEGSVGTGIVGISTGGGLAFALPSGGTSAVPAEVGIAFGSGLVLDAGRRLATSASQHIYHNEESDGSGSNGSGTPNNANATQSGGNFSVDPSQLGAKLGKHVSDFGGNPANPADRLRVTNIINDIGHNPEQVVPGNFMGQGVGGSRGPVNFLIKGNDVVVTKPDGSFVTILKDGINNTSVRNALSGAGK